MGYDTEFHGHFSLSGNPSEEIIQAANEDVEFDIWFIDDRWILPSEEKCKGYSRYECLSDLLERLRKEEITASGRVQWTGEMEGDFGEIIVRKSEIFIREGDRVLKTEVPLNEFYRR